MLIIGRKELKFNISMTLKLNKNLVFWKVVVHATATFQGRIDDDYYLIIIIIIIIRAAAAVSDEPYATLGDMTCPGLAPW